MEFVQGIIRVNKNGTSQTEAFGLNGCEADAFRIEIDRQDQSIKIRLVTNEELTIEAANLEFRYHFKSGDRMFCNGFQSWTDTGFYPLTHRFKKYKWFIEKYTRPFGDHTYHRYSEERGHLHSWDFGMVMRQNKTAHFIGSLTAAHGFTLIEFITAENRVIVSKDIAGLRITGNFDLFDLVLAHGSEDAVWQTYFMKQGFGTPVMNGRTSPIRGWTSWYHYFHNIDEHIILHNLKQFGDRGIAIDYVQIDDGWQQAIGDWLHANSRFSSGMDSLASHIRQAGYRPGLWLAPFVCQQTSFVYRSRKEWLLKDSRGRPVKAGFNPRWGGTFYALDIYQVDFRDYLREVFERVCSQWGFELVKLDFLYAACLVARPGKSRGTVMTEAMEMIRDLCGNTKVLGCGVPLLPAAGRVDYCRVGPDVGMRWDDRLYQWLGLREGISTIQSIKNTIARRQLDGHWFLNDPDVFVLRKEKNKLSPTEQFTLLLVNHLFGRVLFTSDDISNYSEETMQLYRTFISLDVSEQRVVEHQSGFLQVALKEGGRDCLALINISEETHQFDTGTGTYRSFTNDQPVSGRVYIRRRESVLLRKTS